MGDTIKKAEDIKVNAPEVVETKTKKVSVTYTLQRFRTTIETLAQGKMLTDEEKKEIVQLYNAVKNREIGKDLEL